MNNSILNHPMYSSSDYDYFISKGYTQAEILALWDRDAKRGESPVVHTQAADVVGVVSNPEFYGAKK